MSVIPFTRSKAPPKNPAADTALLALVRSSLSLHDAYQIARVDVRELDRASVLAALAEARRATQAAADLYVESMYPARKSSAGEKDDAAQSRT
ncbi:MAG: hypothetical protein JNK84_10870 [Phreatobacter sp.]|uniref:hypothetical protein n=1 Tax=Phreatobacter sp. TaxID=1966341 RepID=UPI001A4C84B4|nr:hypothetical protein [Phreatobacter sp.]MBL8569574.1 hypothetical protein [Phreatobacter sp.]